MLNFVIRLYAILLRLYPRAYRETFADEMQNVFISSITDAAQRGNIVLIHTCRNCLICPVQFCANIGEIAKWRG